MSDAEARTRPGRNLDYPYQARPELGESIEVVPGVHWVRMRLPMQLNHINLWVLEDGDGWTVVDSGIRNSETVEAWEKLFAGPMGGRPVRRVIVTHLHPDHIGLAGWLTRKFDVELWITRTASSSAFAAGSMLIDATAVLRLGGRHIVSLQHWYRTCAVNSTGPAAASFFSSIS